MKDYKIIYTNKGEEVLVDTADYEWLNQWKWHINDSGYALRRQHIKFGKKKYGGIGIRMHRLIMDAQPGTEVDHINRVKTDNRRNNLRFVTSSQNSRNIATPRHNTSGHKWICWDKTRKRWHVSYKMNSKKINVGRYDTLEEAQLAVKDKIEPFMKDAILV